MATLIIASIVISLTGLGYGLYQHYKLKGFINNSAGQVIARVTAAENMIDKDIASTKEYNEAHVKTADTTNLLNELSGRLHSRGSN